MAGLGDNALTFRFEHSRTTEGRDVAAVFRNLLPFAEVTAILDGSGAVTAYDLTVEYHDAESCRAAREVVAAFFEAHDWKVEWQ